MLAKHSLDRSRVTPRLPTVSVADSWRDPLPTSKCPPIWELTVPDCDHLAVCRLHVEMPYARAGLWKKNLLSLTTCDKRSRVEQATVGAVLTLLPLIVKA